MADRDTEAIQAVLVGDVERFAELVERYQRQAQRVAFSLLGNYEDARDASQEAFVNAFRSLGRFRHGARFSTWLYRIVVNECKDTHKRRRRQPVAAGRVGEPDPEQPGESLFDVGDPGADPQQQSVNRELGQRLSMAISRLPLTQRTAFVMHHVHGMPLEEIAVMMACRVGTVKSHLFRATASLRTQMTPWLTQE